MELVWQLHPELEAQQLWLGTLTTATYLQKHRIFAFLHTLLNKIQRLLHVLTLNGILNLLVAPMEDVVIGHGG